MLFSALLEEREGFELRLEVPYCIYLPPVYWLACSILFDILLSFNQYR